MGTTLKGQIIREKHATSLLMSLGSRNGARWQAWLDPEELRKAIDRAEHEAVDVLISVGDDGHVELYLTRSRITGDVPITPRESDK